MGICLLSLSENIDVTSHRTDPKYKYALLCGIAAGVLLCSGGAYANPSGGNVVAGSANIMHNGSTTTIEQLTNKAIIEWQDFSISPGELTQFLQSGSDAAVLNKVISSLPSSILGQLKANGNVFLINPNGIVIGNGAQIDANSFIASTLNVSNADFMAGGDLRFQGESTAAIINLGEIRAGAGDIFLLARQIKNAGHISAPQGEVGLAAGSEIYLSATRANGSRITVKANKFAAELKNKIAIENTGAIEAARAILTAYNGDIFDLAINNSGIIKATGLSKNADGTISLFATTSNGKTSGKIRNSGALIAQNQDGSGGSITISGKEIALTKSSLIDASASETYKPAPKVEVDTTVNPPKPGYKPGVPTKASPDNRGNEGAGTVLVGGDYQGRGDVATAENVTIEDGSTIQANAGAEGDGGKIIVWADKDTRVAGTIEARGGAESGNGGFVETSGKETLKVDGDTRIDIAASNSDYKGGQWLLDPTDITIADSGGDVATATINTTLNSGGDVTITTVSSGSDNGDITLSNATINKTSGGDATLSLVAERSIKSSGTNSITSSSGALSTIFQARSGSGDGGNINLASTTITTNGGDVIMGGGANPLTSAAIGVAAGDAGVVLDNVDINTGAGNITITGQGYDDAASSDQYGVYIHSGSVLDTTTGTITLNGTGGAGDDSNRGIRIEGGGTQITSVDGNIVLTGQGGSNGQAGSSANHGILIDSGAEITSTGTGASAATITLTGTGGAGAEDNRGIHIGATGTQITSVDGDIVLIGHGATNGQANSRDNHGILLFNDAEITSTGTGPNAATITLTGTAGAGDDDNNGVRIGNTGTLITSVDGNIVLTGEGGSSGRAGSNGNQGVLVFDDADIISTGTGADAATITLTGTAGAGEFQNRGIQIGGTGTQITSVDGDIVLTGEGATNGQAASRQNFGVLVVGGAEITSTGSGADAATITLTGTAGAGDYFNYGIRVGATGTQITSVNGDIVLTGQGGSNGQGGNNYGIYVDSDADIISTGTGADAATITLTGTGGAGDFYNAGIRITSAGTQITSVDGDISLTGEAGSDGQGGGNYGINLDSGADIISTGTGADAATITLTGTGGAGDNANSGIRLENTGTLITSVDGDIVLTGQGRSNGQAGSNVNLGIFVLDDADIISTGTGANAATITLTGTGGAGEDSNHGIAIANTGTLITSVDGDIVMTGTGGSNGETISNSTYGTFVYDDADITSTGSGPDAAKITLTGTGGAGYNFNRGLGIEDSGTLITSVDGDISLTGRGGGNGQAGSNANQGVHFNGGADITSTGTGADAATITIEGIGGDGDSSNLGYFHSGAGSDITSAEGAISITGQGQGSGSGNNDINIDAAVSIQTTAATTDIIFRGNTYDLSGAPTITATGDITIAPRTAGTSIGLGVGAGTLQLDATELSYFTPAGRLIIGDSVAGTGSVRANGVDIFANTMDVYGGDMTLSNLSNIDGSTSTFTARTGDLILFEDDASSAIGATILDELKANFQTLAGDLILTPETASDSIGVAGGAGTFSFSEADLQGWTQIGNKLVLGNPASGAGAITVNALDLSAETYGIGFYGSSINLAGAVQSGADIKLAADSIAFNNHDLIADDDVIITTQNTALDIGVSGGTLGPIDITDAVIDDIFAGNDGTGNLIIGDEESGSGTIDIDGLDLTGAGYGLKLYGGTIDLNDQALTTEGDLVLGADTLSNFTVAVNADGFVEVAPRTAVLMAINEPSNEFTLNGDTFSLALLNNDADAAGSEGLILGSSRGGDLTWTSATHDFAAIDARTGANLTLTNTNAAASYGLGDGTSGDITYTTAQLEAFQIGGELILGNSTSGTGTIDIADLSGADTGFGLNASGASIDIGGWNGGANDITLLARTGAITSTEGGTISGANMDLNAAGAIGTSANRLNTSVDQIDYVSGSDVYITEADAVTINSGVQNGAGTTDIATVNGQLDLASLITLRGDGTFTSGGLTSDFDDLNFVTSAATGASTLTVRAGRSISNGGIAHTLTNSNAQTLNVVLNADRNADQSGNIQMTDVIVNTNGGDVIMGGGSDPEVTMAWGTAASVEGIDLDNTQITTGTGDITLNGHGYDGWNGSGQYGVYMQNASTLTTTTGGITLNGTGGAGEDSNYGIWVVNTGTQITSIDGDIVLTGQGGSNGQAGSNGNFGIFVNSGAEITSTGSGVDAATITLTGTGGAGENSNHGIAIANTGTQITSVDGDIALIGQGGSNGQAGSNVNYGIYVLDDADIISTGTGTSAATITLKGTGGAGEDSNHGIAIANTGTLITSVDGDIVMTGTGGSNGQADSAANHGIRINDEADITSTGTGTNAATITLNGTGGAGEDSNHGIWVTNTGTQITSIDGDIALIGQGGSNGQAGSTVNYGIYVVNDADIISTGTGTSAATITLTGTGGAGEDHNRGVAVTCTGTLITSIDGDIVLAGQGGSNGQADSAANHGIRINDDADITSTGTGTSAATITLSGTGGAGEDHNYGIWVTNTGTQITSIDGDIVLTGQGGSNGKAGNNYNHGVLVDDGVEITSTGTGTNAATIAIGGTGAAGSGSAYGVSIADTDIAAQEANISIASDSVTLGAATSIETSGSIIFVPRSSDTTIGLGGGTGDLNLTDTELGYLTASRIVFGDNVNGANSFDVDTVSFGAGTDVEFYGGTIDIQGNVAGVDDLFVQGTSINQTGAGLSSINNITFQTNAITLANTATAGNNFNIRSLSQTGTVGLGSSSGQDLNLSNASLALFDATAGRVNIGYSDSTAALFADNVDVGASGYDLALFGGDIAIQNGFVTGGELLVQANTGNITVNNGQVSAVGQSVFDVQQGSFRTNQGADIWNVTGGNYILYADSIFSSDVQPLNGFAQFVYGADSTSRSPSSLGTGSNFVVLKQDLGSTVSAVGVPAFIDDIQAVTQQSENAEDDVYVSSLPRLETHLDSPYLQQGKANASQTSPEQRISLVESKTTSEALEQTNVIENEEKNPVRLEDPQGIGLDTGECTVTSSKQIVCTTSSSSQ